ncbi:MAG: type I-E CRISPR-associated protein Cse1/CasA [Pseudorhodobacter sp.]|nr:type I-E CRISPR-associated protein Cse1/CasA [Pseudorhodobacter sp.]
MPLNLISDPWIPVLDTAGQRRIIAPWQMAGPGLLRPDWPRADLNITCLELLIGLVFLADPPEDVDDWQDRQAPDADRLRGKLSALAPAFNLTGEGPLFLQDFVALQDAPNPPDMLFIDSAGAKTAKDNADLMVRRKRYVELDLPLSAMALYTFQAHAPEGGRGNMTSMRGGGPMVTLVDPGAGLWPLIWANVPDGKPQGMAALPWMRPTKVSDTGVQVFPPPGHEVWAEAFFGMPRRLRLVVQGDAVTGVIQRPSGTNYAGWEHPLTPYYREKPGGELRAAHPRPGRFGYRHWLGILAEAPDTDLRQRARVLRLRHARGGGGSVIVAGWAMKSMKPRDFIQSVQPFISLEPEAEAMLAGLIEAAEQAGLALRMALEPLLGDSEAREAEREAFYADTEAGFQARLADLQAGRAGVEVAADWLGELRRVALARFEARALPGLDQQETDVIARIVMAQRLLRGAFSGFGKYGREMFGKLCMTVPATKKKVVA